MLLLLFLPLVVAVIISLVMGGVLVTTGASLLAAAIALPALSLVIGKCYLPYLGVVSVLFGLGGLYFLGEGIRYESWKSHYYNPSDDTTVEGHPPPTLLVVSITKIFRRLW